MTNSIEKGQKIGVPVCSAINLTEAQLARAEEHVELYGQVTVKRTHGRVEYVSGEDTMRVDDFITIISTNGELEKKQGKKNPGRYLLRYTGK
jgi:hypothetical protein